MKDRKILKPKHKGSVSSKEIKKAIQKVTDKRMTPKELIALGASINQIVNILDNLDILRRNLLFTNSLTNEQEVDLLKTYSIIEELQNEVEEIINKETK